MIFKRLFQPKYQHKDPTVRIQALQQLNPQEPQQKTILHELAFNDSDATVSLAALDKLDNFDLWWKMAGTSKDQRVAKKSKSKVEAFLLGQNGITLPDTTRRTFILECHDSALLEMLLQEGGVDESDTELMLAVLTKLNKPQVTLKMLLATENESLRKALFEQLDSESDIAKVAKKASHQALTDMANQKLQALAEAKEKPVQLLKDTRLVLSKLLALVDSADYEKLVADRAKLEGEFKAFSEQFSILTQDDSTEFEQKFASLQPRLQKKEAALYDAWSKEQAKKQQQAAFEAALARTSEVLTSVHEALSANASTITLGQLEQFNQQIEQVEQAFQSLSRDELTQNHNKQIESSLLKLNQSRSHLDDLPALQIAITQAKELLAEFKQAAAPQVAEQVEQGKQVLSNFSAKFKDIKASFGQVWPKEIDDEWHQVRKTWKNAISDIEKQADDVFKKCRDKLNFVNAQVKQGRFRNAIRHYEKVAAQFEAMSENQQRRLSKTFEGIKSEIENLKDWQDYIAAPRKPELLQEIEALAKTPLAPEAQAKQVKALRAQWLTLGSTGTEADEALNKTFDETCEVAFKPCRDFYAEQDAKRTRNLNNKFALLDALEAEHKEDTPMDTLDKALNTMRKKWRDIGDIDYKLKDSLDERYRSVVNPIKSKIDQFYQDNASIKQGIIKEAEALVGSDNWQEATQIAKQLQDKWKQAGRAHGKVERKLWESFRSINDQIFAKRDEAVEARNAELETVVASLQDEIAALEGSVNDLEGVNDLLKLKEEVIVAFDAKLAELPHNLVKPIKHKLKQVKAAVDSKLAASTNDKSRQLYQTLFDALAQWDDEIPEQALTLGNVWKQAFLSRSTLNQFSGYDREMLVIAMEVVCGVDASQNDDTRRKQVQLELMASKLQGETQVNKEMLLEIWVNRGPLSESDKGLLNRIQPLFLSQ